MSAVNMRILPDRVLFATDAGGYTPNNVIVRIASKVALLPRERFCISFTGRADISELIAEHVGQPQERVMAELPKTIRRIRDRNERTFPGDDLNDFTCYVGMWNLIADEPQGWLLSTGTNVYSKVWGSAFQPFRWFPIDLGMSNPAFPGAGVDEPATADEAAWARGVLEAQRKVAWSGSSTVGGFGELTVVTRGGVTKERVCEWPDRVGERIAA